MQLELFNSLNYIKRLEENRFEIVLPLVYSLDSNLLVYRPMTELFTTENLSVNSVDKMENALNVGSDLSEDDIMKILFDCEIKETIHNYRKLVFLDASKNPYSLQPNTLAFIQQTLVDIRSEVFCKMIFNLTIDSKSDDDEFDEQNENLSINDISISPIIISPDNEAKLQPILDENTLITDEGMDNVFKTYKHTILGDISLLVTCFNDLLFNSTKSIS